MPTAILHTSSSDPARVLRLPEVIAMVGLRRSSIYGMVAAGMFPRPVRLGARAVAWRRADLEAWLAARQAA